MKTTFLLLFTFVLAYDALAQFPPVQGLTKSPDSTINASKQKIKNGDQLLIELLGILKKEADLALKVKPSSVMDKGLIPPSGDKHDYISQGPYWWPDPSKADGLPYIRKDGEINPEIKKFKDHDNMKALFSNVEKLAKAYYFTEDEQYAAKAIELISVWFINQETRMNPHLEFGQGIPGINTGRSIGIIETPGLASIVDAIVLLRNSPKWTIEKEQSMQNWMSAYLHWLITSEHGKKEAIHPNNHGTYYDVQAISLALFTGQKAVAIDIIEKAKKRRFDTHIVATGEQPHETARTKGLSYSLMNLKGLMEIALMADKLGIDLWTYKNAENANLKTALDYLVPFATAKEPLPFQQISPVHSDAILHHLWIAHQVYGETNYLEIYKDILKESKGDLTPLFY